MPAPPEAQHGQVKCEDPDAGWVELRSLRQQWLDYVLLCLAMVAWTIDASVLPNFFREFQILFGVGQADLNTLHACKGWAAAIFALPCAFVGELLPRPQLIGMGMVFWAAGLALCAGSRSFELLFVARVLNGIGLGIVQPLLCSLVADTNRPTKRGSAFGAMFFTGNVCQTIFNYFATKYAVTEIAGMVGWRWSLLAVAAFSSLTGMLIMGVVTEPSKELVAQRRETTTFVSVFRQNMPKVLKQDPDRCLNPGPGRAWHLSMDSFPELYTMARVVLLYPRRNCTYHVCVWLGLRIL
jgi:predicted MFS family arabinose efflux permease